MPMVDQPASTAAAGAQAAPSHQASPGRPAYGLPTGPFTSIGTPLVSSTLPPHWANATSPARGTSTHRMYVNPNKHSPRAPRGHSSTGAAAAAPDTIPAGVPAEEEGDDFLRPASPTVHGGLAPDRAAQLFRAYDLMGRGWLSRTQMVAALAELGAVHGLGEKGLNEVLGQDPATSREARYSLQDFLAMYERIGLYQSKLARGERIRALSSATTPPPGAATSPALRLVFNAYCHYAAGTSRMLMAQAERALTKRGLAGTEPGAGSELRMNAAQLIRLCQDMGLLSAGGQDACPTPLTFSVVDVVFAKSKPPGAPRRLTYTQWLRALAALSDHAGIDLFAALTAHAQRMQPGLPAELLQQPQQPAAEAAGDGRAGAGMLPRLHDQQQGPAGIASLRMLSPVPQQGVKGPAAAAGAAAPPPGRLVVLERMLEEQAQAQAQAQAQGRSGAASRPDVMHAWPEPGSTDAAPGGDGVEAAGPRSTSPGMRGGGGSQRPRSTGSPMRSSTTRLTRCSVVDPAGVATEVWKFAAARPEAWDEPPPWMQGVLQRLQFLETREAERTEAEGGLRADLILRTQKWEQAERLLVTRAAALESRLLAAERRGADSDALLGPLKLQVEGLQAVGEQARAAAAEMQAQVAALSVSVPEARAAADAAAATASAAAAAAEQAAAHAAAAVEAQVSELRAELTAQLSQLQVVVDGLDARIADAAAAAAAAAAESAAAAAPASAKDADDAVAAQLQALEAQLSALRESEQGLSQQLQGVEEQVQASSSQLGVQAETLAAIQSELQGFVQQQAAAAAAAAAKEGDSSSTASASEVAQLQAAQAAASASQAELAASVTQVQESVTQLAAEVAAAAKADALQAMQAMLEQSLASVEQKVAAAAPAAAAGAAAMEEQQVQAAVAAAEARLAARVQAMEGQLGALSGAADAVASVGGRMAELSAGLSKMQAEVDAVGAQSAAEVGKLAAELQRVDGQLNQLVAQVDALASATAQAAKGPAPASKSFVASASAEAARAALAAAGSEWDSSVASLQASIQALQQASEASSAGISALQQQGQGGQSELQARIAAVEEQLRGVAAGVHSQAAAAVAEQPSSAAPQQLGELEARLLARVAATEQAASAAATTAAANAAKASLDLRVGPLEAASAAAQAKLTELEEGMQALAAAALQQQQSAGGSPAPVAAAAADAGVLASRMAALEAEVRAVRVGTPPAVGGAAGGEEGGEEAGASRPGTAVHASKRELDSLRLKVQQMSTTVADLQAKLANGGAGGGNTLDGGAKAGAGAMGAAGAMAAGAAAPQLQAVQMAQMQTVQQLQLVQGAVTQLSGKVAALEARVASGVGGGAAADAAHDAMQSQMSLLQGALVQLSGEVNSLKLAVPQLMSTIKGSSGGTDAAQLTSRVATGEYGPVLGALAEELQRAVVRGQVLEQDVRLSLTALAKSTDLSQMEMTLSSRAERLEQAIEELRSQRGGGAGGGLDDYQPRVSMANARLGGPGPGAGGAAGNVNPDTVHRFATWDALKHAEQQIIKEQQQTKEESKRNAAALSDLNNKLSAQEDRLTQRLDLKEKVLMRMAKEVDDIKNMLANLPKHTLPAPSAQPGRGGHDAAAARAKTPTHRYSMFDD